MTTKGCEVTNCFDIVLAAAPSSINYLLRCLAPFSPLLFGHLYSLPCTSYRHKRSPQLPEHRCGLERCHGLQYQSSSLNASILPSNILVNQQAFCGSLRRAVHQQLLSKRKTSCIGFLKFLLHSSQSSRLQPIVLAFRRLRLLLVDIQRSAMAYNEQRRSIVGNPFENGSLIHESWITPSKFNVALAKDTATGKSVVLKLYDVKGEYDKELGFLRDLNNSNARRFVLDLKGATEPSEGCSEVRYGIAMEVLGENVHDYLSQNPELSTHARIALALNLVQAVQAIHQNGVAHCDLKPHQVCLTRGIGLKLIDFDSARCIESFEPLDRFTTMYAAPEVVRAAAAGELSSLTPTKAIDLWPLGLMLAQIFTPTWSHFSETTSRLKKFLKEVTTWRSSKSVSTL